MELREVVPSRLTLVVERDMTLVGVGLVGNAGGETGADMMKEGKL